MSLTNRRDLLRAMAACGAYVFTSSGRLSAAFLPGSAAGCDPLPRKMLLVFLRGANDGINTVIPVGDTTYPAVRPVLNLTNGLAVSGSTFAKVHPGLQPLVGANSPDEQHRIAWMHQVGNPEGTRSHFSEMQIWETADVPDLALNEPLNVEGLIARLAGFKNWPGNLPAAGMAAFFRMFHAPASLPTSKVLGEIRNLDGYHLNDLFQGLPQPEPIQDLLASKLGPHVAGGGFTGAAAEVAEYGDFALKSMATVASLPDFTPFVPPAGATPGDLFFLEQVRDAMRLLRHVPDCRVVGVNYGGFDTHADQLPRHDLLLSTLGVALRGVHDISVAEGVDFDESMLTLVISEFGRTVKDNGSGTDHGLGSVTIGMGKRVNGAVYNCDATTWGDGLLQAQADKSPALVDGNALPVVTDFRAVYAEILQKWFAVATARLPELLPDLNDPVPPPLAELGFLMP